MLQPGRRKDSRSSASAQRCPYSRGRSPPSVRRTGSRRIDRVQPFALIRESPSRKAPVRSRLSTTAAGKDIRRTYIHTTKRSWPASSHRAGANRRACRDCRPRQLPQATAQRQRRSDNSFHRLFSCRSGRNRRLFSLIPHPASRGCAPACRRSCARGPTRAASPTPRGRRCRPANWASSRRSLLHGSTL